MKKRTILVISPHTDDIELSCGGSLSKWISEGAFVYYVAFSDCRDTLKGSGFPSSTLENECRNALGQLGISITHIKIHHQKNKFFFRFPRQIFDKLERLKEKINPDLVVIPSITDTHLDHLTVAQQAISVFRRNTSIISYEQPWNNMSFTPNLFVALTASQISKKIRALGCYKSQYKFKRPYFDNKFIEGWARMRGIQINQEYAEAFQIIKLID